MANGDLSNRNSSLGVKDVGGMMEELSRQLSLPEGGLLRGEVLRTFDGGSGFYLRDPSRMTVEVRIERALHAERGDVVEVDGTPELVAEALPVGLRVVWRGIQAKKSGASQRFRARRAFVKERAGTLPFDTPRISPRLRSHGRVRVVTARHSKAWEDVAAGAGSHRWLKPDPHYCEDLGDPVCVAATLASLIDVVSSNDVVLVTRGGSELADLDVFEDERVVDALANLTERCATILAVGHASDDLMTSQVVTYPGDTPSAALHLIVRESSERSVAQGESQSANLALQAGPDESESELAPEVVTRTSRRSDWSVRTASAPPPAPVSAARSGLFPRLGVGTSLLLLGVAACAGWWARGFFQNEDEKQGQTDARPMTNQLASLAPALEIRLAGGS